MGEKVGRPKLRRPRLRGVPQELVAGEVAVRVVVALESVQVDECDAAGRAVAAGALELERQLLLPGALFGTGAPARRSGATLPAVYVSLSRLRVPVERADQLVLAFRRRSGLVDDFDGFLDLEVWQSDHDVGEIVMVSRWRDRQAFRTYMRSEEHARSHDRIDPELDALIRLERLEHLHTYEVVGR